MRKLLQNEQGHWNAQIIAALIADARHRFKVAPAPIRVMPLLVHPTFLSGLHLLQ